ncbi:hypothetical protein F5J12DRAFT_125559 [Pisolithus orientalis]|uniref:uncharacterized protein n=1 Tax=Pisolithus orientalis TaxID=936130 RepID=UPI002225014D|nr:uncharacterized protein F5J12DRAFT_125559 [Pisolithus orientalis]KAI6005111.1 hypothetical protein F5J12DRAFT_125559 [Pisolithus orientalis]
MNTRESRFCIQIASAHPKSCTIRSMCRHSQIITRTKIVEHSDAFVQPVIWAFTLFLLSQPVISSESLYMRRHARSSPYFVALSHALDPVHYDGEQVNIYHFGSRGDATRDELVEHPLSIMSTIGYTTHRCSQSVLPGTRKRGRTLVDSRWRPWAVQYHENCSGQDTKLRNDTNIHFGRVAASWYHLSSRAPCSTDQQQDTVLST